jgi:hypothetical protein
VPPNQADFPKTAAGIKAYRDAREIGLNITQVPEAVSQGNLLQAQSEITGDPEKFAKDLGFTDWTKVTPQELRMALYTKQAGRYTPSHVNEVMASYENARRALPVSQGAATEAAKLNAAEIKQAFEMNTDALSAIADANNKAAVLKGLPGADPFHATQEVARYNAMTEQFFKDNYAQRYQAAMKDNNGQPLAGDQKMALSQASLQSTIAYGKTLADQVVRNKADVGKTAQAAYALQHPEGTFEATVMAATKQKLKDGGMVATDIQYPGVPKGAFLMMTKEGRPQVTPNGSFVMLSADKEPFYFNPKYNVLPQGAPQPTEAPAELQPPAAPAAKAEAKPAEVPPTVQKMADAIDNFHQWAKTHQVEGSGKAFMDWIASHMNNPLKNPN